jgi:hypothetical protein
MGFADLARASHDERLAILPVFPVEQFSVDLSIHVSDHIWILSLYLVKDYCILTNSLTNVKAVFQKILPENQEMMSLTKQR